MWTAIMLRVTDIIENDSGMPQKVKVFRGLPNSVDFALPNVVLLPQSETMQWIGGNRHETAYVLQMRLHLAAVNTELPRHNEFSTYAYLDAFRVAFLSRPQLQYGDTALQGMSGNLLYRMVQGSTRPVDYPPNTRQALFWGAIMEITVPMLEVIPIQVTGQ